MSTKIIAYADALQVQFIKELFPDNEVIQVQSVEQIYLESLEGFMLFFFDHKTKVSQKISGIDKFIQSFNGHNSFGLQFLPMRTDSDSSNNIGKNLNMPGYEVHFLQYVPLRRFSVQDFTEKKPWLDSEAGFIHRKHIRLSIPLPIEIVKSSLYTVTTKTYAEDVSMKGIKAIGDLVVGEIIKIKSPLIPDAIFEGLVRWNIPWGKLGQIAYGGIEFMHNQKSTSYKSLAKFMREVFVPNLSRSGRLE